MSNNQNFGDFLNMEEVMRSTMINAHIPYPQCLMYYYIHIYTGEGFCKKDMNRLVDNDYAFYGYDPRLQKIGVLPTAKGVIAAKEYQDAAPTCPHCWQGKIWRKYGYVYFNEEDQAVEQYYHYCDHCGQKYRETYRGDPSERIIPLCNQWDMRSLRDQTGTGNPTNTVDALIAAAAATGTRPQTTYANPAEFVAAKAAEKEAEKEARDQAARQAGYMLCPDCMLRAVVRTKSGSEIIWECTQCGASWASSNNGKSLGARISNGSATVTPTEDTPTAPRM